jgi:hypothetical protein
MSQGQKPQQGFEEMEGRYILGIAGGVNASFANGITALGTTQATAATLPAIARLISVDSVAAGTGVNLPQAIAGTLINIYNAGANAVLIYPAVRNNAAGVQDTINTTLASISIASHSHAFAFCAENGNWSV